jgi:hypothetical protein
MADETLYVTTGAAGIGPQDTALEFVTLDRLLGELGERIYVAGGTPPEVLGETAWDAEAAARFALDCAEHVVAGTEDVAFPSGATIGQVIAAARGFLDDAAARGGPEAGLLQKISRLAQARRLRKMGDELATAVNEIVQQDERADLDALDDPAFASVAAVRDAVLAAVEALRHLALPHLAAAEEAGYESSTQATPEVVTPVDTPWGSFLVGGKWGAAPAALTAREAAERARQAAAGDGGAPAEGAERSWQLDRLAEALTD